ncbi:MAG: sulfotransferase [Desulfobacteraceae bacterium]|nr:sulfotransferase [Desulfobacteraceae bacterium]
MLPDHQAMPGLARLINTFGEKFADKDAAIVRLNETELLETISRRSSLKDYGDPYFREGLNRFIDSVAHDADLTFLGRLLQRAAIERSLENRLKFIDYQKKRPDVFERELIPPIIVLGLPRSGTTFFHRLLAQDDRNRGLYFWELTHPIPPVGGRHDYRKLAAKLEYNLFRRLTKHFDHIHVIRDTEYEECIFLMTLTFQSGAYWMLAPVYSYVRWCMGGDRLKSYADYVRLLKIFQAQSPARRLVLKAPAHTGSVNEILRLMPNAILVQTHRHPVDVCNSVNSLVYAAHCNVVKRLDVRKMAEADVDMLDVEMRRNLFSRSYHGVRVHDILYAELLADPLSVVKNLYARHGIEFGPQVEARMKVFIAGNPQHKHGTHRYCSADFGMTDAQITDRFEEYMNLFGYKPR